MYHIVVIITTNIPYIPKKPMANGMVCRRFEKVKPLPIPEPTHDQIIMVLPIPVSHLSQGWLLNQCGGAKEERSAMKVDMLMMVVVQLDHHQIHH